VASMDDDGVVIARELPLDEVWQFVVVVPDEELATSDARRALPDLIPFSDAVANLSALGLLIAGLGDHRKFVPSAMDDTLHQPYRRRYWSSRRFAGDAARSGSRGLMLVRRGVVDAGTGDQRERR